MQLASISTKVAQVLNQNAALILTSTGVVGTVGTGVLAARAGIQTGRLFQQLDDLHDAHREENGPEDDNKPLTKKEKFQHSWAFFLPPVGVAGLTIASVVGANRVSAKQVAALAAAYSITESQFQDYKDKALEKLGVNKEKALRDEVAADQVKKNPPNKEVIIVANGDVLFYDTITGRYFESTVEKVKKAETHIHSEIYNYMGASLSVFFDDLGLPATDYTDNVGWNSESVPEVDFSTTTTPDDRPCMTVTLHPMPKPDYDYKPY